MNWVRVRRPGYDDGDWQINRQVFVEEERDWLSRGRKQITVDCACDSEGYNSHCSLYCSKQDPFDASQEWLLGRALWANPDFRRIRQYVEDFVELRRLHNGTEMILITPAKPNAKWWSFVKDHFELKRVISRRWKSEKGELLFTRPRENDPKHREQVREPPWDVCVWYSKEQVYEVGTSDAWRYEEPSTNKVNLKVFKKFTGDLFVFGGTVQGGHVSLLSDPGAQVNLISESVVRKLGLPTYRTDVTLGWLNAQQVPVREAVEELVFEVKGKQFRITNLLVTPLAKYDCVLGMPWHEAVGVEAKYRERVLSLEDINGDRQLISPVRAPSMVSQVTVGVCNFDELTKLVKQGSKLFAIQIFSAELQQVVQSDHDIDASVVSKGCVA